MSFGVFYIHQTYKIVLTLHCAAPVPISKCITLKVCFIQEL